MLLTADRLQHTAVDSAAVEPWLAVELHHTVVCSRNYQNQTAASAVVDFVAVEGLLLEQQLGLLACQQSERGAR